MTPVIFHPQAHIEFIEAARYYEYQSPGLGLTFITEVRRGITAIQENPEAFASAGEGFRRKVLHRFPYTLLYAIEPDNILIVALMHQKRRPAYWKDRLQGH